MLNIIRLSKALQDTDKTSQNIESCWIYPSSNSSYTLQTTNYVFNHISVSLSGWQTCKKCSFPYISQHARIQTHKPLLESPIYLQLVGSNSFITRKSSCPHMNHGSNHSNQMHWIQAVGYFKTKNMRFYNLSGH